MIAPRYRCRRLIFDYRPGVVKGRADERIVKYIIGPSLSPSRRTVLLYIHLGEMGRVKGNNQCPARDNFIDFDFDFDFDSWSN